MSEGGSARANVVVNDIGEMLMSRNNERVGFVLLVYHRGLSY
jgi:hypothetical protein